MSQKSTVVRSGISFGCACAITISWSLNHSLHDCARNLFLVLCVLLCNFFVIFYEPICGILLIF
jgi:hypothetical protein